MTPADILAELEQIDRRRVTLMEKLKAALADAVSAPPIAPFDPGPPDLGLADLIPAGAAAALARRS